MRWAWPRVQQAWSAARRRSKGARHDTPALELVDLTKKFGLTEIIRGVSLAIAPGERHAIIGPNGAGKTTLFHLISGRLAPSSGGILLAGRQIEGLRPYQINRLGLSRSFQVTNIFPKLSVYENLLCATLWRLGARYSFWESLARRRDAAERAEALAARIGLAGAATFPRACWPTPSSGRSKSASRSAATPTCCCSTNRPQA